LSKEYRIPPAEIGQRFSSKDIGQIIAFEQMQAEAAKRAQREAELEAKAKNARINHGR